MSASSPVLPVKERRPSVSECPGAILGDLLREAGPFLLLVQPSQLTEGEAQRGHQGTPGFCSVSLTTHTT